MVRKQKKEDIEVVRPMLMMETTFDSHETYNQREMCWECLSILPDIDDRCRPRIDLRRTLSHASFTYSNQKDPEGSELCHGGICPQFKDSSRTQISRLKFN